MSNYVITISRQFASMGRTIGLKMASNLNIELLDRDIVKVRLVTTMRILVVTVSF